MRKKTKKRIRRKGISNTKLMFLSILLLFIVLEALFILKVQQSPQVSEVAGTSSTR